MPNEICAKDLANSKGGLVIAPAGCGKTHLICEAVLHSPGRQLVLTHTHAGVKAIRDRMTRLKVPSERYMVCTLDGFALRYASAFPTLSGWVIREPKGNEWQQLRPAATAVLRTRVAEEVLRASYSGVYVDEYQDCSIGQHNLVAGIASVLPCRVLGDPLQSIYFEVNKREALPWAQTLLTFPVLGELSYPHRWAHKNESLGGWLLEIRAHLLSEGRIDLSAVPHVKFVPCEGPQERIKACYAKLNAGENTVVGLRKHRNQCHDLAGKLGGTYSVFEDANCEELLRWAEKIERATGLDRVRELGAFAGRWLTRLPGTTISKLITGVCSGHASGVRRPDLIQLTNALAMVRDNDDWSAIPAALAAFIDLKERPIMKSREVWMGLSLASAACRPGNGKTLVECAWHQRDIIRRSGRKPWSRSLSTPLLVKGLEFDHCLILRLEDFPDVESLYVSLTRGSRSVTILGDSPLVSLRRVAG